MSNASAGESEPIKPQRPLTALQQLEAQLKETRAKVTAERSRIKKERFADKQKSHVQMILGSIVAHGGNERIAKALASADWLDPNEKLAVEYYYGLRENPKNGKKPSGGSSDGKSSSG